MRAARTVYRIGAAGLAILAVIAGYFALTLRWIPAADFDIIGFLWVFQNLPRLTAFALTAVFGGCAVYAFIRSTTV